jgi:hypothetical protein
MIHLSRISLLCRGLVGAQAQAAYIWIGTAACFVFLRHGTAQYSVTQHQHRSVARWLGQDLLALCVCLTHPPSLSHMPVMACCVVRHSRAAVVSLGLGLCQRLFVWLVQLCFLWFLPEILSTGGCPLGAVGCPATDTVLGDIWIRTD